MSLIRETIEKANSESRLALSIYLTSGYPDKDNFVNLALSVLEAGADMLEIGIPFSDPLADGPIIQKSSFEALQNGVTLEITLDYCRQIRRSTSKPIILMGYLNPILIYGLERFFDHAVEAGVNGLIIPDLPLEEHTRLFKDSSRSLDITLLTTPTSNIDRIKRIDSASSGFVYCVSVTGTTGIREGFSNDILANLQKTHDNVIKNKMMIGFGISNVEDIIKLKPYCNGVIVGSAVIKSLMQEQNSIDPVKTLQLINKLKTAC